MRLKDKILAKRIAEGDEEAFNKLYYKFKRKTGRISPARQYQFLFFTKCSMSFAAFAAAMGKNSP